jgi:hypothetical protein
MEKRSIDKLVESIKQISLSAPDESLRDAAFDAGSLLRKRNFITLQTLHNQRLIRAGDTVCVSYAGNQYEGTVKERQPPLFGAERDFLINSKWIY